MSTLGRWCSLALFGFNVREQGETIAGVVARPGGKDTTTAGLLQGTTGYCRVLQDMVAHYY